jgi:hypothetical protein
VVLGPRRAEGDRKLVQGPLIVRLVELHGAIEQDPDQGHVSHHLQVALVRGDRAGPGGQGPVEEGNVLLLQAGQSLGSPQVLRGHAALEPQSVEPVVPLAQRRRARHRRLGLVGGRPQLRRLLQEGISVLREAARHPQPEPDVIVELVGEALHHLQSEGDRVADQLRVVVAGQGAALAGRGDRIGHLVQRVPLGRAGEHQQERELDRAQDGRE